MSGAAAAAAPPLLDRRRPELRAVPSAGRDGAADVRDGVADRRAILWRARDLALLADAHGAARARSLRVGTSQRDGAVSPT